MGHSINFSSLKGIDLQDLLIYILNYDLEYRDSLDINENVTFGIEIEYERMFRFLTDKFIKKNIPSWRSKADETLLLGGEVTSPVMNDNIIYWKQIKEICKYLRSKYVITNDNAGGHIHVGAHILGDSLENWRKFLKMYTIYEDILFRFLYGDKISGRKKIYVYGRPISYILINRSILINEAHDISQLKSSLPSLSKSQAVNFTNIDPNRINEIKYKNTIEFRSPNATVDEIIWQNNINALVKLITSSINLDESYLDYKIRRGEYPLKKSITYNEVCLKKVLEFVDLIFDNNEDKIYFLRQYIKGFEEVDGLDRAYPAKQFTKHS